MPPLSRFPWPLVRIFVLGAFAVASVVWAIVRAHTVTHPPMLVQIEESADGGVGEIPAPPLVELQDFQDAGR